VRHKAISVLVFSMLAVGQNARADDAIKIASPRAYFDQALNDFDEGQKLLAAQPDRARQLFRSAAQKFAGIAASGVTNGKLEFNLGNAHLQAGDLGRAILHYRRAERLIPGDPLLAGNLATARSRCLTQIPAQRGDQVLRSVFFWHYQTSEGGRASLGLIAYATAFALLLAGTLFVRRVCFNLAAVAGAIALACAASVAVGRWSDRTAPPAVITAMDVVVYKGPGASYQRQFEQPLQPGVECEVRQRRGNWWEIELPDGKTGWIESTNLETVAAD